MSASARQVGGDHYQAMPVQPWEALEAWLTPEQFSGFLLGTAIAYLARFNAEAPAKGGLVDLEKAMHTLERLIEHEAEREDEPVFTAYFYGMRDAD